MCVNVVMMVMTRKSEEEEEEAVVMAAVWGSVGAGSRCYGARGWGYKRKVPMPIPPEVAWNRCMEKSQHTTRSRKVI